MKTLLRGALALACSLALAIAPAPLFAQHATTSQAPAGYAPEQACVTWSGGTIGSGSLIPCGSGGGGGGGGGDASAANQTAVQATAGSDASKAAAVQGITGGKPVPVSGTFFQATQPVSATSLPLPLNAAQETGGNLAAIAANTANNATVANQTAVQATAGSDASKAVAVQGVTGGKAIEVGGHAIVAGGSFTRPANATAYVANSLYANSITAGSVVPISAAVCRAIGGHGAIIGASLAISNPLAYNTTFRLHIFKGTTSSPFVTTAVGDGGTWTGNVASIAAIERATIDVTLTDKGSDGAKGWGSRNIGSTANVGGMIPYDCNVAVQNMYVMIETTGAYTPTSGETATVALEAVED